MLLQPGLQQFGNEITRSRNVRFSQGGGRLSNIGIKGRRTGLQARDVNKDSDGFANVDEFFDSPITTATAPSNIFGKSSLLDGAFDDDIDDDSNNNNNNNDNNNNDSNDIHSESSVSSDAELTLTTNNEKNLNIHSNDTINHNNDEAAVRAMRRKSVSYADSPSNTMPASGGFDDDRYAPLSSDDESEQAYDVVRRASPTKARRRRRRDEHVDHSPPPPFAGELQQTPRGSAVWSGTDGRLCLTPVLVRAKFLPSVANIARPVDGVFRAVRRKLIRKIYVPPPPRDRDARSRRRRRHHGRHRRRREHEASPRASIAKPQQRSAKKLPPKTPITVAGERVQFDDLDDGVQVGPLFDAPSGLFAARVMTLHANAVYSLGGSKAAHTLYVAKGSVTLQFDGDSTLLTHAAGTSFVIRPKQRATLRTHPTCSLARLNHYAIAADAFLGDDHSDDDY